MWKSGYLYHPTPKKISEKGEKSTACRFIGTAEINKVSGNFHILPGLPVLLPGGHAHVQFHNPSLG